MPELLLELFGEEIPARMQARAAEDLARLLGEALAPLAPQGVATFHGPRRIALVAEVAGAVAATRVEERGPRIGAPEQAIAGFLRKHGAAREQLREAGEYWLLEKSSPARDAASLIAAALPGLLRRFPWPKSMRWGGTSGFTWVRPLRRILCMLDGRVVPFDLREPGDDGHGLAAGEVTEGHRFLAPGPVVVSSFTHWHETLRARRVIPAAEERRRLIRDGIAALAAERGLSVVPDDGLLDEVAGLVEWPVPLLGRIDDAYMDLPPEVMQVSMRVNQRYFALRRGDGQAAPYFGFAANIEAPDGGATIIAGNERVLRARFADARHFWDLDRRTRLADRVAALDAITFHAKLGSQGARVRRLERLAAEIAPLVGAGPDLAARAARLAKADLTTGMVGEFPELQGVMGGYYARHDNEDPRVAAAVRDHYAPKGPGDAVPAEPVAIAAALADKLDLLCGFFAIGEKPTGSGDPYALRRAGLGIIRIIRENALRLRLAPLIARAGDAPPGEILDFLAERLRVQLRGEGARHDVLAAVFAAGADDDLVRLLARTDAVAALLGSEDGRNLLAAHRRAANILRIEDRRDGPHTGVPDPDLLDQPEERALAEALDRAEPAVAAQLQAEDFAAAMSDMAQLRAPLDAFFERVTVNAADAALRRNRLRLLSRVRRVMDRVADFSKIEG
jgi:glycyl-tRNA synthetase beta chain